MPDRMPNFSLRDMPEAPQLLFTGQWRGDREGTLRRVHIEDY
jgi:hypothetical protein